jgi:hypothetical protein
MLVLIPTLLVIAKIVAFGEDVGKIGDVNQAFAGYRPNMEKNESTIPESGKPV